MRNTLNIFTIFLSGWILFVASVAGAQESEPRDAPEELEYRPLRIVVLPFRDYDSDMDSLFFVGTKDLPGVGQSRDLERSREAIENLLATDPRTHLISSQSLLKTVNSRGRLGAEIDLIRDRYHLARDLYDDLRLEEAEKSLDLASRSARKLGLEVIEPSLAAKIALIRGLNAFERSDAGQAHIALKRALILRPEQRFRKGYYPEPVEKALKAAWMDVLAMESKDLVVSTERIEGVLERANADQVLTGYVERQGDRRVLRLVAYDGQTHAFTLRESVVLEAEDGEEGVSRAISRWLACLSVPLVNPEDGKKIRSGDVLVDFQLAHGLYLSHPTRDLFNNIGLSVNLAYRVLSHVDIGTKLQLFTSIPDSRKDLEGHFTSVRWIVGAGMSFGNDTWLWFIRPGVELHYVGSLSVVTDPDCKFFGVDHPRCEIDSVTDTDQAILGGLHMSTGASWELGDGAYIVIEAGASLYVSFREESNLNYLIDSGVGVGYRF